MAKDWSEIAAGFAEQAGLHFDHMGHPRMGGRVFGWLLSCEPDQQSVAEIAEALQASRSAVNAVIKRMTQVGIVERVAVPGERSIFYRIKPDAWVDMMRGNLPNMAAGRRLADQGLALFAERGPDQNQRLQSFRDAHAFFERELPLLLERLEREMILKRGADD